MMITQIETPVQYIPVPSNENRIGTPLVNNTKQTTNKQIEIVIKKIH